jgi:hypothetical protein
MAGRVCIHACAYMHAVHQSSVYTLQMNQPIHGGGVHIANGPVSPRRNRLREWTRTLTSGIQCLYTWIRNFRTWYVSDTGFCKLFLIHDLENSVFNVHQVPKIFIHVHQHQVLQVHEWHCQLYMPSCYNIVKLTVVHRIDGIGCWCTWKYQFH